MRISSAFLQRLDEDGLLDQQARFWSDDRDQVDVVLRRTDALLKYWLKKQSASRVWLSFQEQLDRLKERAAATQPDQAGKDKDRHSVYIDLCALRRRIVLANPLLDFDDLVFVEIGDAGDRITRVGLQKLNNPRPYTAGRTSSIRATFRVSRPLPSVSHKHRWYRAASTDIRQTQ